MNEFDNIICVCFLITGLGITIISLKKIILKFKYITSIWGGSKWVETSARITINEIDYVMSMGTRVYRLLIEYTYKISGSTYTSDSRFLDKETASSNKKEKLVNFINKHPKGSVVKIISKVDNPKKSYILKSKSREAFHLLIYMLILFSGMFVLSMGLSFLRDFKYNSIIKEHLSNVSIYAWLIFGILFFIILSLALPKTIKHIIDNNNSKYWKTIKGTILKSELSIYRQPNKNMFTVDFIYEFYINNIRYTSEGRYLHPEFRQNRKREKDISFIENNLPGAEIDIKYDINNPYKSLICTTNSLRYVLISMLFISGIIIAFVIIIFQFKKLNLI